MVHTCDVYGPLSGATSAGGQALRMPCRAPPTSGHPRPSSRALALDLGIARNTVADAWPAHRRGLVDGIGPRVSDRAAVIGIALWWSGHDQGHQRRDLVGRERPLADGGSRLFGLRPGVRVAVPVDACAAFALGEVRPRFRRRRGRRPRQPPPFSPPSFLSPSLPPPPPRGERARGLAPAAGGLVIEDDSEGGFPPHR